MALHDEQEKVDVDDPSNEKALDSHVEDVTPTGIITTTQMRSKSDDASVWQSMMKHKVVGAVAMAAAFSASLDGYQITLNGGIVSNKGFIRQFATSGTKIIDGKYISAWGGIQSAGQFIGQIVSAQCPKIGFQARTDSCTRVFNSLRTRLGGRLRY